MSSDAVLFAGGVVALTFAEYVVHRFVLHGFAPTEHRLHHANADGAVLTIFRQVWICFALVYLIAGVAAGGISASLQRPMIYGMKKAASAALFTFVARTAY
jgi:hypothetical protein